MDDDLKNFPYEKFPYGGVIKEVPVWEIVVKSVIYGIITISSLFGNVLIIVIVMKNKTMKTVTNYYIVNLAVADLMVTLTCTWVTLVDNLTEGWILGAFFCKLNTFTKGNFTKIIHRLNSNANYFDNEYWINVNVMECICFHWKQLFTDYDWSL